jgi:hypothetical protein|tara:strand:+ start:565 stop:843 length:279 start_codon:yes stop_codon:yes gene_type:complete
MKLLKNAVVAMVAISISLVILNADQDSAETHVWTKKGTTWQYTGEKSKEKKQIHIIEGASNNSDQIINNVIKMPFVTVEGQKNLDVNKWRKD